MQEPTALSLLPPVVVIALALLSRRPIFSLLAGTLTGLLLLGPIDAIGNFAAISVKVMMDETIAWLILVCGFFGALIALLIRTGGALAFGKMALRHTRGPRSSLLMTWLLGLLIFIDDYLNALTVGETMKRVTDRFRISREMLAYVVDSTAAPVCVLVPFSTWAVFFSGLLENNGVAAPGAGIETFVGAIPYMLYAWLAVFLVPLVAAGVVPAIGPMKKAEQRTQDAAVEEHHDDVTLNFKAQNLEAEFEAANPEVLRLANFLVPIVSLVFFTWYFDIDVWRGLIVSIAITLPFYWMQRLVGFGESLDVMLDGFKTMIPAIGTVVAAFIFKDVCDQLMLPQYVVNSLAPLMSAKALPVLVFVSMAALAFATGSSWGIFAVTIPIVVPMAEALDVEMPLVIGALLSASAFGSQACFYSDSTVLAAQGAGCHVIDHAVTQFPYALIAALLAALGFWWIA